MTVEHTIIKLAVLYKCECIKPTIINNITDTGETNELSGKRSEVLNPEQRRVNEITRVVNVGHD